MRFYEGKFPLTRDALLDLRAALKSGAEAGRRALSEPNIESIRNHWADDGADGETIHALLRALALSKEETALARLELDAQVPMLLEAVDENLARALAAEKALEESACTRWGVWVSPSEKNSSTAKAIWAHTSVVIAYPSKADAMSVARDVYRNNDCWRGEARPLPTDMHAVPEHMMRKP